MKFVEKVNNLRDIEEGDIILTKGESERMIIRSGKYGKYATVSLDGMIQTEWYNNLEDLLKVYQIRKVIKKNNLKLIEL